MTTYITDATDPRCAGVTLDAAWAYSPATPLAPGDRAFAAREYRGAAASNRVIDRTVQRRCRPIRVGGELAGHLLGEGTHRYWSHRPHTGARLPVRTNRRNSSSDRRVPYPSLAGFIAGRRPEDVMASPAGWHKREAGLDAYQALGYFPDWPVAFCRTCGGEGGYEVIADTWNPWITKPVACPDCTDPEEYL